jgi:acyl-CoA thioesterase FadM
MFHLKTTIRLHHTDAAGHLFFSKIFDLAQDTLEEFLASKKKPLSFFLNETPYLFPIVHAESDYKIPLKISDPLLISLETEEIGTTSFKIKYTFFKETTIAAEVRIIYVVLTKSDFKKCTIPEELKHLLKT